MTTLTRPDWVLRILVSSLMFAGTAGAQADSLSQRGKLTPSQIRDTAQTLFAHGDYDNARKYYLEALPSIPQDFDVLKNLAYCYYSTGPRGRVPAAHYYLLAYAIKPGSIDVGEKLAKCLLGLDRRDEAMAILRKLTQFPNAGPAPWRNLAEACEGAGRDSEAAAAYKIYLSRRPDDFEVRTKLGNIYGHEKAFAKALDEFHTALTARPDFPPAVVGMARVLSWQHRFKESLRLYDRLLKLDAANGEAASGKAFTLLWSGRNQEAQALFSALQRRYPHDNEIVKALEESRATDTEKIPAHLQSGEESPQQETPQEVPRDESYYRDRLARDATDPTALAALARFASTPERCAEGIDFARQGLALSPDDLSLQFLLAQSLVLCRQYAEAIQRLQLYLKARPKSEEVLYELGQALLGSRRTIESIAIFKELLHSNPGNIDAGLSLAQGFVAAGQFAQAQAQYDEVLKISSENYEALQGKAYVLYWTKQFPQSKVVFQSLATQRPGDAQNIEALENLGRAEEGARWAALRPPPGAPLGDFVPFYEKRLANYPDDLEAMKGLAYVQAQLKNLPAAIQGYRLLAEKYPDDVDARTELARLLSLDGQYHASIELYREIVRADPANTGAVVSLAGVYTRSGRAEEAISVYQGLSVQYPGDIGYKLDMARLEMSLKDYPAAREVLAAVLSVDPRNYEARTRLAQLELSEGAWNAAFKHFGQLLKEDSADPNALMGKAQTSYYQGRFQPARSSAARLVSVQPDNFDAVFLLSNIERASRNRRGTLAFLDQAEWLMPGNAEVVELKKRVREEPSVTLTTSAIYAREIGPPAACQNPQGCGQLDLHEDLRSSSYGSKLKMTLFPGTDSYLSFTALPSAGPAGRDFSGNPIPTGITGAVAPQDFLYRQTTRLSSALSIRAGAGVVRFGPGRSVNIPGQPNKVTSAKIAALAQGGLSFSPTKKVSLDLDAIRASASPTPTAIRLGVMENRYAGVLNIFFTPRTQLHLGYAYSYYASERFNNLSIIHGQTVIENKVDHDQARHVSAVFSQNLIRSPRFSFDAGYSGLVSGHPGHAQPIYLGFFSPGFYQTQLLTTRFDASLWGALSFDFSGGVGIQQIEHGGAVKLDTNLNPAFTFKVNRSLLLTLGYSHYSSSESLGRLRGNAIRLSTEMIF